MAKRKSAVGWKNVIIGTGVVIGTLFLNIAVLSLLIQKAILSIDAMHIGLAVCCLISGIAVAVYSGRGERGVQRLFSCMIPAAVIVLVAALESKETEAITFVVIYAVALLLPSVVSEAAVGGGRRKSGRKRKRRSTGRPNR